MPKLLSLRADAAARLTVLLGGFDPDAPRDTLLEHGEAIVLQLHLIATVTLLADGNAQGFFLNLCRMGENWRRLMVLLRGRGMAPPSARRNTALLATLAAGHFPLAAALAEVSATPRQEDDYEDEYLWASLLQELARPSASPEQMERLLAALEQVGEQAYGHRAAVVHALLARDERAFVSAFEAAQLDQELDTEKRARAFGTPVTPFAPHRFLWLEGLALLRLAERAGLACDDTEWRLCPPLARVPMTARYGWDWTLPGTPPA
jgi:hypothetical protein